MRYFVTDIETVPTSGVGTIPEPTPEKPDPFPPLPCHVIAAIGYMEFDGYAPVAGGVIGGTEEEMLRAFSQAARGKTLVTWNGRTFDLPVIVLRCLHYGIQIPWYYNTRDVRYRFSDAGHHDVMDFLADFGAARGIKLDEAARLVGLPGKLGVDGSDVKSMVEAGRVREVQDYCMNDVAQTAFVWLRVQFMRGEMDLAAYQQSAQSLVDRLRGNPGRYGELVSKIDEKTLFLRRDHGEREREQTSPSNPDLTGAVAKDGALDSDAGVDCERGPRSEDDPRPPQ